MKHMRPERWGGQLLHFRISSSPSQCAWAIYRQPHNHQRQPLQRRHQSSAAAVRTPQDSFQPNSRPLEHLPSPPPEAALSSAKLAALHARLSLSPQLPLQTLARCLVDPTADTNPSFNNASLASLGSNILSHHTAEYLLCSYPRLPLAILFAALYAYCGSKTLSALRQEWGVEIAAEPGGEVDPGLLQFKRLAPGASLPSTPSASGRPDKSPNWRRGLSSRIVYDDAFGDVHMQSPIPSPQRPDLSSRGIIVKDDAEPSTSISTTTPSPPSSPPPSPLSSVSTPINPGTTIEAASSRFVHAVTGAIYLHSGRHAAKAFYKAHIESRKLDLSKLFYFKRPTFDLSRLCAREGFEPPLALLTSETGRLSRHPVFVVGVYSGKDKLGEAAGGSLDEARIRAASAALRGWYLYSPADRGRVPSDVEGQKEGEKHKEWEPVYIDPGEIIA